MLGWTGGLIPVNRAIVKYVRLPYIYKHSYTAVSIFTECWIYTHDDEGMDRGLEIANH